MSFLRLQNANKLKIDCLLVDPKFYSHSSRPELWCGWCWTRPVFETFADITNLNKTINNEIDWTLLAIRCCVRWCAIQNLNLNVRFQSVYKNNRMRGQTKDKLPFIAAKLLQSLGKWCRSMVMGDSESTCCCWRYHGMLILYHSVINLAQIQVHYPSPIRNHLRSNV